MPSPTNEPQPVSAAQPAAMMQLLRGHWVAQALSVAAKLGIADLLGGGAKSSGELAASCGAHAPSLHRLMRALAAAGVYHEEEDGRFRSTALGSTLRTDHPGSLAAVAVMLGEPWIWRPWGELLHSVRTGEPAFPHVFGRDLFGYVAADPGTRRTFDAAMAALTRQSAAALLAAYDFGRFRTVVDVGGGSGILLTAVLQSAPDVHGVVFDLPEVVEEARAQIASSGLESRCRVAGGDAFAEVPSGGDAYLLKNVLHDFDDERCAALLGSCRRAMRTGATLLVVEAIPGTANAAWLDLHMLVQLGGRERTEEEMRTLLGSAGFRVTRILPTASPLSIVEAVAA